MSRSNPHHPGETVREDCIEALGLTIAKAAAHLQIEESALAAVCACEAPITADLAIRFEQAFGSTADTWLRLQNTYDLAKARKTACDIKRIERAA
ncbi:MAG: HigA family addiction module antitoxin [Chloroflexi bacterium]|nr:HigA family addiction module antitoxin [Chloroflexota bacterium]